MSSEQSKRPKKSSSAASSAASATVADPVSTQVSVAKEAKIAKNDGKDKQDKQNKPTGKPSAASGTAGSAAGVDKLQAMWSENFKRLEAMVLAQKVVQPTFQPVVTSVAPRQPAASAVSSRPFIPPAESTRIVSSTATVSSIAEPHRSSLFSTPVDKAPQLRIHQESDQDNYGVDQVEDSVDVSGDEPDTVDGESVSETLMDFPSEEQSYRETVRGVRAYMGWSSVPEFDTPSAQSDNPFAGLQQPAPTKVSIRLPPDEWLCKKLDSLNLTIKEGYPSRSADSGGLIRDQFLKMPTTRRWYGMHSDQPLFDRNKVTFWQNEPARLNNTYNRIARHSVTTRSPPSRPIPQEVLRRWERALKDSSVICNQSAGFSRCLTQVQEDLSNHLRVLQDDRAVDNLAPETQNSLSEIGFLVDFNNRISRAMARSMQDISDFVFNMWANIVLVRRDSFLDLLRSGVKQDTYNALRTGPIHLPTLFLDETLGKAESELNTLDNRPHASGSQRSFHRPAPYPTHAARASQESRGAANSNQSWRNMSARGTFRRGRGRASSFSQKPARSQQSYK